MPIDRLILVVSDDPDELDRTVSAIVDLGYAVLRAENGGDALAVLAENPAIDLLLVDLNGRADRSGIELVRRAREISPKLQVLYAFSELSEAAIDGVLGNPRQMPRVQPSRLAKQVDRSNIPASLDAA